jgi:hypothetical protein
MVVRLMSLFSVIGLVLALIRRRKRRRAREMGQVVVFEGDLWKGMVDEFGLVLESIRGKIKDVIKMGTTITYV